MSITSEARTLSRVIASAASLTLLVAACSGETGGNDDAGGVDDRTVGGEELVPEARCTAEITDTLPEGFDRESCWAVVGLVDPVLAGDRVFAVEFDTEQRAGTVVVGFDPATGEQVWQSTGLPGPVIEFAPTEVEGEPGVAVVVTVADEGDAVTEPFDYWGYLAWPADDAGGGQSPPPVHISTGADNVTFGDLVWTEQGLIINDEHLLRSGDDEFVAIDHELGFPGDETAMLVGPSGGLLLWYVMDTGLFADESPDHAIGAWRASRPDGTVAWETPIDVPSGQGEVSDEEPVNIPALVGGYVLNILVTGGADGAYEVEWLEAATGEQAQPEPEDLAGAIARGVESDTIGITGTAAWATPDGGHLYSRWANGSVVVDVETGVATPVESDYAIAVNGIDEDVVYGSTDNGRLTIDLATGEATPVEESRQAPVEINDRYGVFFIPTSGDRTLPGLAIARRTR
jgi:hypothetical protein